MEINADLLIKATKVDGVYSEDPHENPDARRFATMTYMQALEKRVGVMDATAISLCMENELPILVLNVWQPHSLEQAVLGESIGTLISR
jgi:uridylate kinase